MRTVSFRAVFCLGLVLAVAGCKPGGLIDNSRAGFKSNYMVARTALERGEHTKAARHYKAMLREAGPLEPRIRLEYAHALLREGKYTKAAAEARIVADELTGAGRAAALAVLGTAEHEAARAAISKGRTGSRQIDMLRTAQAALTEMLALNPELDPTGGMQARLTEIARELQAIL